MLLFFLHIDSSLYVDHDGLCYCFCLQIDSSLYVEHDGLCYCFVFRLTPPYMLIMMVYVSISVQGSQVDTQIADNIRRVFTYYLPYHIHQQISY
jgi:hypothetical protein